MDPRVYDINTTKDLSFEQQNIVHMLSDMFFGYSLVYIRGICEACLWNVDLCIDKLIRSHADNTSHDQPQQPQPKVLNYSQALPKTSGAVPKAVSSASLIVPAKPSFQELPANYAHVYSDISKGYKVLVLMRGPPGSGKSYLAKAIVKKLMPGKDWKDFVFGADDYFFDARGRYRYNVDRLENAHIYCQTRAREKMSLGYSPIIIDNTNNALWEMLNYVKPAVENGYMIEIIEPVTPWRNSAGKLAAKNVHNVPKHKIQRLLDRYEVGTSNDLLALLKETKYTVELPQLRTYPPPPEPEPESVPEPVQYRAPEPLEHLSPTQPKPQTPTKTLEITTENIVSNNDIELVPPKTVIEPPTAMEMESSSSPTAFTCPNNMWPSFEPLEKLLPAPRSPRKNLKVNQQEKNLEENQQQEVQTPITTSKPLNPEAASFWGRSFASTDINKEYENDNESMSSQIFPAVPTVWQAYEQESTNFWGVPVTTSNRISEPMALDESSGSNCGLLQLLKEGVKSINVPNKDKLTNEEEAVALIRHRVGCENENEAFIALRQIYPNKPNAELWDLFVKCNGSIDWAVDILLKDEDSIVNQNALQESLEGSDNFDCCCNRPETCAPRLLSTSISMPDVNIKSQRQKPARNRAISSAQILEVKEAVEKSFVLGEEHYSSHVNKIRNKRNPTEESNNKNILIDVEVQTEDVDENDNNSEDDSENSEMIEINLGEGLIGQLSEIFISETSVLEAPEKYKTNVFMPKTLARELYVLWMESVYNQQEEQRQSILKEDEEFARLLKNPKYQNLKQPPENIKELLDMEYAWMIYKTEQEQYNGLSSKHPTDLASHLTRMKLCEIFPNIPPETLLDILAAHNNKFSDTVEVLKSSIYPHDNQISADVLIERARNENEKLNEEEDKQEQKILKNNNSNSFQKIHSQQQESAIRQRSLSPEEAKRLALSEFEETRNYAVHHCQLRAECYQKAKEAIQRGNSGVAVYYSQIANLHKRKIDIYNHRAANCIMEVHDLTQNNPDFIDLHYLHVVEAVACLDIFVDRHIAKLRSIFRSFKYVFIITGRGLHSTGGVSMIKTRVKSRLKERNLKWSEVNPGLLKVKIFSASKYSKNL